MDNNSILVFFIALAAVIFFALGGYVGESYGEKTGIVEGMTTAKIIEGNILIWTDMSGKQQAYILDKARK